MAEHRHLKIIKADLERLLKITELMESPAQVDRISNLPWEVLDNILGRLEIERVAMMSLLSRRWKNNWRRVSSVILLDPRNARCIYHVMLSHIGNIEKFTLFMPSFSFQIEDVITWLNLLRRNDVKEISLQLMSSCQFYQLSGIDGFSTLRSLTLESFTMEAEEFEELIDGCPRLESLKLLWFRICGCIRVNAHALRLLHLDGEFHDVCTEGSSNLTDVYINMEAHDMEPVKARHNNHMVRMQFLSQLSQFEKLTLGGSILKILATRRDLKQGSCNALSVLSLRAVDSSDTDQISAVFTLLRSASNLKEVSIELNNTWHSGLCTRDVSYLCFKQLKSAKIDVQSGQGILPSDYDVKRDIALVLITRIMASSPVLREMVVNHSFCDIDFMREFASVPRASTQLMFKYFCNHCVATMDSY